MSNIQPKSGKNHKLFGHQFYKVHRMEDDKWKATDKITQYVCMTSVYKRNQDLVKAKHESHHRAQVDHFHAQKDESKVLRLKLKSLLTGDVQRLKNIFQNDKEQQLVYPYMPLSSICQSMQNKIFDKRKAFDRLLYEKRRLSKLYERRLLDLAILQDQLKYSVIGDLPDEVLARGLRLQLKDSQIRMKAYEAQNRDCVKLIDTLSNDTLYYNIVLNALQEDVQEQAGLIEATVRVGLPALINFDKFKKQYNTLERQFDVDSKARIATLLEYKEKLQENEVKLRQLVLKDSEFKIVPNRYNRETSSMLEIQKEFQAVEQDMKALCAVTACSKPENVIDAFIKGFIDKDEIKGNLLGLEQKLRELMTEIEKYEREEESLINTYTNDDIACDDELKRLDEQCETERVRKEQWDMEISKRKRHMFVLQYSLQHFSDLLKFVGSPQTLVRTEYPNSMLQLPLLELHLESFNETSQPPETMEENIEKLFDVIVKRIELLMATYNDMNTTDDVIEKSDRLYHDRVMDQLSVNPFEMLKANVDEFIGSEFDPTVLERDDIKARAQKIIAENKENND